MANYVSYENATTLFTEIGERFNALNGAYIIRGNSTFANLPTTLTKAMSGYVYNVTTEFTTTANFVEGAGKKYPAGTNVVIVNLGTDSTPDMKYDVISSFVDVDAINTRIDNVSSSIAPQFSTSTSYSVGDVVMYQDILYKFKANHTAGAWSAADADAITAKDLIDAAEPDSLTTAQVNALLELL